MADNDQAHNSTVTVLSSKRTLRTRFIFFFGRYLRGRFLPPLEALEHARNIVFWILVVPFRWSTSVHFPCFLLLHLPYWHGLSLHPKPRRQHRNRNGIVLDRIIHQRPKDDVRVHVHAVVDEIRRILGSGLGGRSLGLCHTRLSVPR